MFLTESEAAPAKSPGRRRAARAALLVVLAGGLALFFALGLQHALGLASLRVHASALHLLRDRHPALSAALFLLLYVLAAGFSLPVTVPLSLAGGALFGLGAGAILVSFGASIGASLAFLAARFLFRDVVRRRVGWRLADVERGLAQDGGAYLLALRLLPLMPFALVNLLFALTTVPLRRFYLVSQLGMLPMTLVLVNAGRQLDRVDRLSGLLSPGLVAALALLVALPPVARLALRRRAGARPWARPRRFDRNLVVIGAGSAGLVSALVAAKAAASVTLVERDEMGGECLNTGCVPSKALIHAARLAAAARQAAEAGLVPAVGTIDSRAAFREVRRAVAAIAPHDSAERYRSLGVDVRRGHARITSPWSVEVNGVSLITRAIVVATGSAPAVPPIPGLGETGYFTSETLWRLDAAPRRLLILGGGPMGCELAQAFARLGSEVTLAARGARLLPREDEDVSALIGRRLTREGVEVLAGHTACAAWRSEDGCVVRFASAGETRTLACDALLLATGRRPRTEGLGLEALGIALRDDGGVATDRWLRTSRPSIYACGDVAGPHRYTHAASHQAWHASLNALFGELHRMQPAGAVMPSVVYTDPELGRAGLTEQAARAAGIAHVVTRYDLASLDRAIVDDAAEGFVKVLTPPGRDRILGVAVAAPRAGEMLAEFTLAMQQGIGLKRLLATIHAYPGYAEANRHAAARWREAAAPAWAPGLLARYHAWRRG